jgi:bifunctional non-homologous end joining protein LigD
MARKTGSARGGLDEYRRRRDFRRTREPAGGDARSRRRSRLRFVIQKHAASSLHYDLRLEVGGVMRSWAVPKGPSLDPAVKRLAMQVEDHPIEYNTFEGTIPEGEYGGGTVMLWDRGTYSPDEGRRGESDEEAVARGLSAGKLSFSVEGERLRGSFALVRTERGPKPKWLLIKHRDEHARSDIDITDRVQTSVDSGRTMDEIAIETDRVWRSNRGDRAGGEARATRAGTVAAGDLIAPMRPTPSHELPGSGAWTFEAWRGGTRVLAYATPETARLVDDAGHDITPEHRELTAGLAALAARIERPFIIDGELAEEEGTTHLFAADLLLDGADVLIDEPWSRRRDALHALLNRRRVRGLRRQESVESGAVMLRRAARQGWAGLLARRLDAPYQPGARSDGLLRITD